MSKNNNLEYYPEEKILNPPQHARDEVELILNNLTKYKTAQIVDFGSGGGRLTIPLLQNGYKVTAIDIDKKSREQLLKTAIKIGKIKNLRIYNSFRKDEKYDYILGTDILHHVKINKYFKLFNNSLKKGGIIIFSEPNPWNISWWIFIFLFLDWNQEKGLVNCSFYSLKNNLKKYNFNNIKINGLGLFPPQLFFNIKIFNSLNYLLGNLPIIKMFAYRLIINAKK